jgi:tetratricopeptide (TPR) repeat protein
MESLARRGESGASWRAMTHQLLCDAGFAYRSFGSFPLVEHILGVGRMAVAPRFELVDEQGELLSEDEGFLSDLGENAPALWLPVVEDLVSLPTATDLDLLLADLLTTLRTADDYIRETWNTTDKPAYVRWSLPFVWELQQADWPELLALITETLGIPDAPTLEFFEYQDPEGLVDRLQDPTTRLGRLHAQLPEDIAFGLAALAVAAANGLESFSVEDEPYFHEYDEGGPMPHLMERLASEVLEKSDDVRIEQIHAYANHALAALDAGEGAEALAWTKSVRAWALGIRRRDEIALAYRTSAAAWLDVEVLDRAVTDASWSLQNGLSPDAYDTRAVALHISGQIEAALEDYNHALELDPENARIMANRAEAHYDLGNDEACIADAELAMDLNPEDPSPFALRGRALLRQGERNLAWQDAEHAALLGDDSLLEELEG